MINPFASIFVTSRTSTNCDFLIVSDTRCLSITVFLGIFFLTHTAYFSTATLIQLQTYWPILILNGIGFAILYYSGRIETRIDCQKETISIQRRNLVHRDRQIIQFKSVAFIEIESSESALLPRAGQTALGLPYQNHRICFVTNGSKRIPCMHWIYKRGGEVERTVREIRNIMGRVV